MASLLKKDFIVQQAAALFKSNGFKATTMRQLAQQCNMEAASLYNHISSKEALLQEICSHIAHDFNAQLEQIEADESCASRKLEAVIRYHIHLWLTRHAEVYVSNRDWKHLKESSLHTFLQQRRQYENRLAAIIQQGIDHQQFKPIHPHVAVLAILGAVRSIEYWMSSKKQISGKQVTEDLVTFIMKGMETS